MSTSEEGGKQKDATGEMDGGCVYWKLRLSRNLQTHSKGPVTRPGGVDIHMRIRHTNMSEER